MSFGFSNDEYDRYQKGKTVKQEEFGVVYPDGTIIWDSSRYKNPEDRLRVRKEFEEQVERMHVPYPGELRFVSRIKKTSFSELKYA